MWYVNGKTALKTLGMLALVSVFSACNLQLVGTATITPKSASSEAAVAPLSLSPTSHSMLVGTTHTFSASGGSGSKTFALLSGVGSVDPVTGEYTAPGAAGSAVLRVTDGAGRTADASITVYDALSISPANITLDTNDSTTFIAMGGSGGATFSVIAGGGSIGSGNGLYTAPATPQSVTIRVTDSSGATSDASVTVVNPSVNLEVPIELTGGSRSNTSWITGNFACQTRSFLDTDDFDGVQDYTFEIIASRFDPSSCEFRLKDAAGNVKATLTVPASQSTPLRLSTTFTPNTGADQYWIEVEACSNHNAVTLHGARILVRQQAATKTRLYYPLFFGDQNSTDRNVPSPSVDFNSSGTDSQNLTRLYGLYVKDTSKIATIAAGTPWKFEVGLLTSHGSATAFASLYNRTENAQVTGSQLSTTNASSCAYRAADLANDAVNFDEGDTFEVRTRTSNAGAQSARLYRAMLSVKLTNLSKGEVWYNLMRARQLTSTAIESRARTLIDLSRFKNPAAFIEAIWESHGAGNSGSFEALDHGTADSGVASPATITDALVATSATKSIVRSSEISVTNANRLIPRLNVTEGTVDLTVGRAVVTFER